MRANLPQYEMRTPRNLEDALDILASETGTWKPFAGGTDLMVLFEAGKLDHKRFLNIWSLQELKGIEVTSDFVTIGGLTTYTQIQAHEILREEFSMICQAASETGGWAIQNRGTLAGNIANASPAADSPPALLVYDAELELISSTGARKLPYKDFHLGYKQTLMRPDEIIRKIRLPRNTRELKTYYRKVGTRKAQAISKVCFAGVLKLDGNKIEDVHFAFGSIAPVPLRCVKTEELMRGQKLDHDLIKLAKTELQNEIAPIDDMRSTANYRNRVATNLLENFLMQDPQ